MTRHIVADLEGEDDVAGTRGGGADGLYALALVPPDGLRNVVLPEGYGKVASLIADLPDFAEIDAAKAEERLGVALAKGLEALDSLGELEGEVAWLDPCVENGGAARLGGTVDELLGASLAEKFAENVDFARLYGETAGGGVSAEPLEGVRRMQEGLADVVALGGAGGAVAGDDDADGLGSAGRGVFTKTLENARGDDTGDALMSVGQVDHLSRGARDDLRERLVKHGLLDVLPLDVANVDDLGIGAALLAVGREDEAQGVHGRRHASRGVYAGADEEAEVA